MHGGVCHWVDFGLQSTKLSIYYASTNRGTQMERFKLV